MPTEVFAALLGAILAFGGTYFIQRGQLRRAELDRVRLRLGATRMLKIDLSSASALAEVTEKEKALIAGAKFPTANWFSHGHLVLGELDGADIGRLMEAFGRFDMLNAHLAAVGPEDLSGNEEAMERVPSLGIRITDAINVVQRLEVELHVERERLARPLTSRWQPPAPPSTWDHYS